MATTQPDYANQLEDKWKMGKKGSDKGALVLLAVDDHKYRIDVGYGLEGILNDAKVGDIGRAMVPYLRANGLRLCGYAGGWAVGAGDRGRRQCDARESTRARAGTAAEHTAVAFRSA